MKNTTDTVVTGILAIIILCISLSAFGAFEPFNAEKHYWKAYKFCTDRVSYQIKGDWEARAVGEQEANEMMAICNQIQKP